MTDERSSEKPDIKDLEHQDVRTDDGVPEANFLLPVMCSSSTFDESQPSPSRRRRETSACGVVSKTGDFFWLFSPFR